MPNPRYRAAVLDGITIVLDLAADEYLAVPHEEGSGSTRPKEVALSLNADADSIRFAGSLLLPTGRRGLGGFPGDGTAGAGATDWMRLVCALPRSLWLLRFGRPSTWLRYEELPFPAATAEAIEAARRFRNMRPFVPHLTRCLPHALLLKSFLELCGHRSALVIGVRLFPFEAHSWVQAGDVVLTDDLDLVAAYSVIAAG